MKLLHSADWHLDAPIAGRTPEQAASLRRALLSLPGQIASLARQEGCQLMLLSGDLFDGPASQESIQAVQTALAEAQMPVFIAPGNHDPIGPGCAWNQPGWSENVHIFRSLTPESVVLRELDCRVWGAAFQGPEAQSLLSGFQAEGAEKWALGVFHGDPTQAASPYSPITRLQVQESGLDYLALGHIHKADFFRAGDTLCAWPGCAMGRGFDETGDKGVMIVTLDGGAEARFLPLPCPRFHLLSISVEDGAEAALSKALPAAETGDFFRVELTGESEPLSLSVLTQAFSHIPNLELRDRTQPPIDLWAGTDADSLEGVFFSLLQQADAPEQTKELAARICHRLLAGQEVEL